MADLQAENAELRRKLSEAFDDAVRTDHALMDMRRKLEGIAQKLASAEAMAAELGEENRQHCANFQAIAQAIGILGELPDAAQVIERIAEFKRRIDDLIIHREPVT